MRNLSTMSECKDSKCEFMRSKCEFIGSKCEFESLVRGIHVNVI